MKIGAQLWLFNAVHDELVMDTILSQFADAGYGCIESMFGKPPYRRDILDRIGMSCYATHIALGSMKDRADLFEFCHHMGAKVVCVSGLLQWNERSAEDYRRSADALNTWGQRLKAEGLALHYHNHDFEFDSVEGETTGMDLLISGLNPEAVSLCFDAGWTRLAGHDPVSFMLKHRQIIGTVHLRDFNGTQSVALGRGNLDLKAMVEALPHLPSVQAVMVEQDPGTPDPVGDMIESRQFLIDNCGLETN